MKKIAYLVFLILISGALLFAQENTLRIDTKLQKNSPNKIIDTQSSVKALNNTTAAASYDFTQPGAAYTTGPDPMIEVDTDVWAMVAGDANGDGTINAVDYNEHWLPENGTAYEYSKGSDFNLDGTINAIDYNFYWLKNNGTATQVP